MTAPSVAIRVSVLIVSWNARDHLARCLRALAATPHEVIVVDNASSDGSAAWVRQHFPTVRLVEAGRNLGFAGGVNLARRQTAAPLLLLLNPDAEATPGAVERLADELDASPDVAAIAGRLVNADGSPQAGFNVRRLPTLPSLALDLLFIDHLWPGNPVTSRYYARDLDPDASAEVEQPAAACLMVRAEVFDRLGGMDERFFPAWFEDVDLCRRMRDAGFRIRYAPAATFVHRGGVSKDTLGTHAFSRAFHANLVRYVRKHHGLAAAALVRTLILAGAPARALARSRALLALALLLVVSAGPQAQVRLPDASDRDAFRAWFVLLADAQFYRPTPDVVDCAALVRHAAREALRPHTPEWLRTANLPVVRSYPDVRARPAAIGGSLALFQVTAAPGARYAEFADAQTLVRLNARFISRDAAAARPGDLLYFHQPSQDAPHHVMVFVGASAVEAEGRDWVVYHTGPSAAGRDQPASPGEVRKARLADLARHPAPRWRPLPGNANFVGVFRFNWL